MTNLIVWILGLTLISITTGQNDIGDNEEYVPFIGTRRDNFDWNLLKDVVQANPEKNIVISPLSAKVVLMMLAEMSGIKSDTRKELLDALDGIKDLHEGRIIISKIIKSLQEVDLVNRINCASQVFITDKVRTSQKIEAIYQSKYSAGVQSLDFSDTTQATETINKFVADATDNQLRDFVSRDTVTDAIVILINAVFFDGKWSVPFKTARTEKGNFYAQPNRPSKVDFMRAKRPQYFYHSDKLKATLMRLPYSGGKYAMFLILPDQTTTVEILLNSLNSRLINREMWYLDEDEINIYLPKFKIAFPLDLKTHLMNMGINAVFTSNASLPLLARGDQTSTNQLLLSQILQQSGIEVTEEGSVAYGATQGQLVNKIGGQPKEFKADRPFLFYIEDEKTGNILFAGKVNDPSLN
uniref:CSON010698 protein n=1 Tax=Culicoides sonorensis TaxID=179676 RepID=A0A336K4L7_CULSO